MMYAHNPPNGGWNLFARVLQEILAAHGSGLGHLDDRAFVHPEKVRRLQRSLAQPTSFPVLNIDEIERVISAFSLTRKEKLRLRAALLATSIEQTLMDRINQLDALLAAEQILPIIEQALQQHAEREMGIGAVKGGALSMFRVDDEGESEIDRKLGNALTAIDRATLALHLSRHADAQLERVERLRQARDGFELAIAQLEKAEAGLQASDAWQLWHDEASNGLDAAKNNLRGLGV